MITQQTKDKIFSSLEIYDIISDYLALKKQGTNYISTCPFHNEKSPSFFVSPAKGIFKCFGCGEGGTAIDFIMKFEKISYPEALLKIAKKYNINVEQKKLDSAEQRKEKEKEQLRNFYNFAADFYSGQLKNTDTKNAKAREYIENRFSPSTIASKKIGLAPDSFKSLTEAAKKAGYKEEFLLKTGLIKRGKYWLYDFFINRVVFPIHSRSGQINSFTGRIVPEYDKTATSYKLKTKTPIYTKVTKKSRYAKYMNLPNTLVYNKSLQLYGFPEACRAIYDEGEVLLVEGNPDVCTLQDKDVNNVVAPSGTTLTIDHAKQIAKYTDTVIMIYDGDSAGIVASRKNGKILLQQGFTVYLVKLQEKSEPTVYNQKARIKVYEYHEKENHDPDSFFSALNEEDAKLYIKSNREDYISFMSSYYLKGTSDDPAAKSKAIQHITKLLASVKSDITRELYINDIDANFKRSHGVTKRSLSNALNSLSRESETKEAVEIDTDELPKYLTDQDKRNYLKYGFYESKQGKERNQYFFKNSGRQSNFIMRPLYHIRSIVEIKKLFELENKYGQKEIIELDMQEVTSLNKFRQAVEGCGNFLFEGNESQFMKLRRKLYDHTRYCRKIEYLGWQEKYRFWAWANGISTIEGDFLPVDEYGIVEYKKQTYFIAPLSLITIEDDKAFRDEKKFIYVKRNDVSFEQWCKLFTTVHGHQSMISVAFYLTSVFSDFIFHYLDNLPLLNIFGVKGTGKNEQAYSLLSLFGKPQNELQVHNATKAGIAAHLEMFINSIAWMDEYKDSVEPDIVESLKGIYNRNGRTKGKKTGGKETVPVNSMGLVTGQEMLTKDIALFSRVLFLSYFDTNRTQTAVNKFNELKEFQKKGLSQLTHELIMLRPVIEESYSATFRDVQADLANTTGQQLIEDRLIKNYATILATFKLVSHHIHFSFTYESLFRIAREHMVNHNDHMATNNEIFQFFNMLETLVERRLILEDENFKIKTVSYLKAKIKKDRTSLGREDYLYEFEPAKDVLFLRWRGIYSLYAEFTKKQGGTPLPESSLRFYLESSKLFLGFKQSMKFGNSVYQTHCFDFDRLDINLSQFTNAAIPSSDDNDDFPSNNNNDENELPIF